MNAAQFMMLAEQWRMRAYVTIFLWAKVMPQRSARRFNLIKSNHILPKDLSA